MIKRNIPNGLSTLRIILSFVMLFLEIRNPLFLSLYLICIISDVLDGYIARRYNLSSDFGAIIDSIADFIFVFVMIIRFIPMIDGSNWIFTWIGYIFMVRIFSLFVGGVKYHTLPMIHTYANKLTGILLCLLPFFFYFLNIETSAKIICTIASFSAVEELIIVITSKSLNRNKKGLWID